MRYYETVSIVKPDVSKEVIVGVIEKAVGTIKDGGGALIKVDEWGRRRLAYPIQKKNEGYYFVLTYSSPPNVSKEIERAFKINEDVIRYQTVLLDSEPKPAEEAKPAEETKPAEEAKPAEAAATEESKPAGAAAAEVTAEGGKND